MEYLRLFEDFNEIFWINRNTKFIDDNRIKTKDGDSILFSYFIKDETLHIFAYLLHENLGKKEKIIIGRNTMTLYNKTLKSNGLLKVERGYRRLGIVTAMYDYLDNEGFKIQRSDKLLDDGFKFWESKTANNKLTLYHGTCLDNAKNLINNGWEPNIVGSGANMGNPNYLYLTDFPENAEWFANEKGCSTIIKVSNIPIEYLRADPEDFSGYTTDEVLNMMGGGMPVSFILTKKLDKSYFSIVN